MYKLFKKNIVFLPLALLSFSLFACEAEEIIKEVVKEVPVEKIVTEEVIKEVDEPIDVQQFLISIMSDAAGRAIAKKAGLPPPRKSNEREGGI